MNNGFKTQIKEMVVILFGFILSLPFVSDWANNTFSPKPVANPAVEVAPEKEVKVETKQSCVEVVNPGSPVLLKVRLNPEIQPELALVSELSHGDRVKVLETKKDWLKVEFSRQPDTVITGWVAGNYTKPCDCEQLQVAELPKKQPIVTSASEVTPNNPYGEPNYGAGYVHEDENLSVAEVDEIQRKRCIQVKLDQINARNSGETEPSVSYNEYLDCRRLGVENLEH
jgi:hypothetical protein